MLVCCAHKELASNPSYSDDKCASRSSHVTVAQSGPCRPMCGPLSLVSCMLVRLRSFGCPCGMQRCAQLDCALTTAAAGMRVRYDGDRANRIRSGERPRTASACSPSWYSECAVRVCRAWKRGFGTGARATAAAPSDALRSAV